MFLNVFFGVALFKLPWCWDGIMKVLRRLLQVFAYLCSTRARNSGKYDECDLVIGHGVDNLPSIKLVLLATMLIISLLVVGVLTNASISGALSLVMIMVAVNFYIIYLPRAGLTDSLNDEIIKARHDEAFRSYLKGRILFIPNGLSLSFHARTSQSVASEKAQAVAAKQSKVNSAANANHRAAVPYASQAGNSSAQHGAHSSAAPSQAFWVAKGSRQASSSSCANAFSRTEACEEGSTASSSYTAGNSSAQHGAHNHAAPSQAFWGAKGSTQAPSSSCANSLGRTGACEEGNARQSAHASTQKHASNNSHSSNPSHGSASASASSKSSAASSNTSSPTDAEKKTSSAAEIISKGTVFKITAIAKALSLLIVGDAEVPKDYVIGQDIIARTSDPNDLPVRGGGYMSVMQTPLMFGRMIKTGMSLSLNAISEILSEHAAKQNKRSIKKQKALESKEASAFYLSVNAGANKVITARLKEKDAIEAKVKERVSALQSKLDELKVKQSKLKEQARAHKRKAALLKEQEAREQEACCEQQASYEAQAYEAQSSNDGYGAGDVESQGDSYSSTLHKALASLSSKITSLERQIARTEAYAQSAVKRVNNKLISELNNTTHLSKLGLSSVPKRLRAYCRKKGFRALVKGGKLPSQYCFLGFGYEWLPKHTRRLQDLKEIGLRSADNSEHSSGSPDIHAVEDFNAYEPLIVDSSVFQGHTLILGTTGAGKTRLYDLLISQAIMRDEVVIVLDPKGDTQLVKNMVKACRFSGREPFTNMVTCDLSKDVAPPLLSKEAQELSNNMLGSLKMAHLDYDGMAIKSDNPRKPSKVERLRERMEHKNLNFIEGKAFEEAQVKNPYGTTRPKKRKNRHANLKDPRAQAYQEATKFDNRRAFEENFYGAKEGVNQGVNDGLNSASNNALQGKGFNESFADGFNNGLDEPCAVHASTEVDPFADFGRDDGELGKASCEELAHAHNVTNANLSYQGLPHGTRGTVNDPVDHDDFLLQFLNTGINPLGSFKEPNELASRISAMLPAGGNEQFKAYSEMAISGAAQSVIHSGQKVNCQKLFEKIKEPSFIEDDIYLLINNIVCKANHPAITLFWNAINHINSHELRFNPCAFLAVFGESKLTEQRSLASAAKYLKSCQLTVPGLRYKLDLDAVNPGLLIANGANENEASGLGRGRGFGAGGAVYSDDGCDSDAVDAEVDAIDAEVDEGGFEESEGLESAASFDEEGSEEGFEESSLTDEAFDGSLTDEDSFEGSAAFDEDGAEDRINERSESDEDGFDRSLTDEGCENSVNEESESEEEGFDGSLAADEGDDGAASLRGEACESEEEESLHGASSLRVKGHAKEQGCDYDDESLLDAEDCSYEPSFDDYGNNIRSSLNKKAKNLSVSQEDELSYVKSKAKSKANGKDKAKSESQSKANSHALKAHQAQGTDAQGFAAKVTDAQSSIAQGAADRDQGTSSKVNVASAASASKAHSPKEQLIDALKSLIRVNKAIKGLSEVDQSEQFNESFGDGGRDAEGVGSAAVSSSRGSKAAHGSQEGASKAYKAEASQASNSRTAGKDSKATDSAQSGSLKTASKKAASLFAKSSASSSGKGSSSSSAQGATPSLFEEMTSSLEATSSASAARADGYVPASGGAHSSRGSASRASSAAEERCAYELSEQEYLASLGLTKRSDEEMLSLRISLADALNELCSALKLNDSAYEANLKAKKNQEAERNKAKKASSDIPFGIDGDELTGLDDEYSYLEAQDQDTLSKISFALGGALVDDDGQLIKSNVSSYAGSGEENGYGYEDGDGTDGYGSDDGDGDTASYAEDGAHEGAGSNLELGNSQGSGSGKGSGSRKSRGSEAGAGSGLRKGNVARSGTGSTKGSGTISGAGLGSASSLAGSDLFGDEDLNEVLEDLFADRGPKANGASGEDGCDDGEGSDDAFEDNGEVKLLSRASLASCKAFVEWLLKKDYVSDAIDIEQLKYIARMDPEYFKKVTSSNIPFLQKLCTGSVAGLFNAKEQRQHSFMDIIKENKVCYVGLHCMSDASTGQTVGKLMLADLCYTAGVLNAASQTGKVVNIFIDEASELACESLVQLLNKSRSSGFKVTIATQSFDDLAMRTRSEFAARQIVANCNNLICLKVNDPHTAAIITSVLPDTTVNDKSSAISYTEAGLSDTVSATKSIGTRREPLFPPDMLMQLPNLEFIARLSNGRIVKAILPIICDDESLLLPTFLNSNEAALYEKALKSDYLNKAYGSWAVDVDPFDKHAKAKLTGNLVSQQKEYARAGNQGLEGSNGQRPWQSKNHRQDDGLEGYGAGGNACAPAYKRAYDGADEGGLSNNLDGSSYAFGSHHGDSMGFGSNGYCSDGASSCASFDYGSEGYNKILSGMSYSAQDQVLSSGVSSEVLMALGLGDEGLGFGDAVGGCSHGEQAFYSAAQAYAANASSEPMGKTEGVDEAVNGEVRACYGAAGTVGEYGRAVDGSKKAFNGADASYVGKAAGNDSASARDGWGKAYKGDGRAVYGAAQAFNEADSAYVGKASANARDFAPVDSVAARSKISESYGNAVHYDYVGLKEGHYCEWIEPMLAMRDGSLDSADASSIHHYVTTMMGFASYATSANLNGDFDKLCTIMGVDANDALSYGMRFDVEDYDACESQNPKPLNLMERTTYVGTHYHELFTPYDDDHYLSFNRLKIKQEAQSYRMRAQAFNEAQERARALARAKAWEGAGACLGADACVETDAHGFSKAIVCDAQGCYGDACRKVDARHGANKDSSDVSNQLWEQFKQRQSGHLSYVGLEALRLGQSKLDRDYLERQGALETKVLSSAKVLSEGLSLLASFGAKKEEAGYKAFNGGRDAGKDDILEGADAHHAGNVAYPKPKDQGNVCQHGAVNKNCKDGHGAYQDGYGDGAMSGSSHQASNDAIDAHQYGCLEGNGAHHGSYQGGYGDRALVGSSNLAYKEGIDAYQYGCLEGEAADSEPKSASKTGFFAKCKAKLASVGRSLVKSCSAACAYLGFGKFKTLPLPLDSWQGCGFINLLFLLKASVVNRVLALKLQGASKVAVSVGVVRGVALACSIVLLSLVGLIGYSLLKTVIRLVLGFTGQKVMEGVVSAFMIMLCVLVGSLVFSDGHMIMELISSAVNLWYYVHDLISACFYALAEHDYYLDFSIVPNASLLGRALQLYYELYGNWEFILALAGVAVLKGHHVGLRSEMRQVSLFGLRNLSSLFSLPSVLLIGSAAYMLYSGFFLCIDYSFLVVLYLVFIKSYVAAAFFSFHAK